MSQHFFIYPSKVEARLTLLIHALALLALTQTSLGLLICTPLFFATALSALKRIRRDEQTQQLVLGEQGCYLNGQAVRLEQQFYNTPWLLVLYFDRIDESSLNSGSHWPRALKSKQVVWVLPDSMSESQRRALSRQLRWRQF